MLVMKIKKSIIISAYTYFTTKKTGLVVVIGFFNIHRFFQKDNYPVNPGNIIYLLLVNIYKKLLGGCHK